MQNKYKISSEGYFQRVINLKKTLQPNNPELLFYIALELRCCIERVIFEYLVILGSGHVEKRIESLWRTKELKIELLKIEPEFIKKLEFVNILLKAHNVKGRIGIPDLDSLNRHYGMLGNFLHAQKRDDMSNLDHPFWSDLTKLINEVIAYLLSFFASTTGFLNLNEHGLKYYEMYKSEKYSEEELLVIIREESP